MTEKSPTEITMEKIRAEWEAPLRADIESLQALLTAKTHRLNQCLELLTAIYHRQPNDITTPDWIAKHVMSRLPSESSGE
jgi:hypothetical protein